MDQHKEEGGGVPLSAKQECWLFVVELEVTVASPGLAVP